MQISSLQEGDVGSKLIFANLQRYSHRAFFEIRFY